MQKSPPPLNSAWLFDEAHTCPDRTSKACLHLPSQKSANRGPRPVLRRVTSTAIHSLTPWGCSLTPMAVSWHCGKVPWPTRPKILTVWPLTESLPTSALPSCFFKLIFQLQLTYYIVQLIYVPYLPCKDTFTYFTMSPLQ